MDRSVLVCDCVLLRRYNPPDKAVVKVKAKIVLILALLLIIGIVPVCAEEINFTLTKTAYNSYSGAASGSGSQYIGGVPGKIIINFSAINSPSSLVLQETSSHPTTAYRQTGSFDIKCSGVTVASGTFDFIPGTYGGGKTTQFDLLFDYWYKGSFTGIQTCTLTTNPTIPNNPNGVTTSQIGGSYVPGITAPITIEDSAGYLIIGNYAITDRFSSTNQVSASDNGGSSLVTFSVYKNTASPSLISVFSKGVLVYKEPATSANTNDILKVILPNKPLIWQANFFNNYPVNSTEYYLPVINYTFDVTPKTGVLSQVYTATASSSEGFDQCNAYTVICTSGQVSGTCLSNGLDPTFTKKADGYWYQSNGTGWNKLTTSFPLQIPLSFESPGTYTVEGTFFHTDGGGGRASDTITVLSKTGTKKFTVNVIDFSSGALISGSQVSLYNASNIWTNITTSSGSYTYNSALLGEYLGYAASAQGYLPSSLVYVKILGDTSRTITLSPAINVPEGNNTLYVYVRDKSTFNGLEGATVLLNDGQTKSTPASGLATFTVIEGGSYSITVSKSGYYSLTQTMTVSGSSNGISMELSKIYVTTPPTLAPGETTTPTELPTPDTRTNAEKDQDMMNQIRDSAPGLIAVAIIMTLLYLVGYKP